MEVAIGGKALASCFWSCIEHTATSKTVSMNKYMRLTAACQEYFKNRNVKNFFVA
jgi:hypothetical protein